MITNLLQSHGKKRASRFKINLDDFNKTGVLPDFLLSLKHKMGDRASGIYMVLNIKTGDYYIGSSLDIHKRIISHTRCMMKDKENGNRLLWRHSRKYGIDNFLFLKVQPVPIEYLEEAENFWIYELSPFYNIARRSIRYTPGDEQRRKISYYSKNRRDNSIYRVPILQYDKEMRLIKEWPSLKSAQDALGLRSGHISLACRTNLKNGKKRQAYGFYWEYKNGMTTSKIKYNTK